MAVHSLSRGLAEVRKIEFSQPEIDDLKANLLRLSKATVIVRGIERDPATGKCKYVEVPDTGIQLAATVKALEFAVGKPKQMMELQTGPGAGGSASGTQNLVHLLSRNPDILQRVVGALKDGLALSEAIPVEAVTSETPPTS